jgi:uncharacterized protein (DUF58 family)
MLTVRGWWCFLLSLTLTAFASLVPPHGHTSLVALGLTLLLWFIAQWLLFRVRSHRICGRLSIERELHDDRGPVDNLWARRSFQVRLRVHLNGWLSLPYVLLNERVPFGVESAEEETRWEGELRPGRPAELSYRIHCRATGRIRFEGIKVELADLQGLFYQPLFLAEPQVYRVLPPLVGAEGQAPTTKRHNLLPPPGVHRHRRPGSGGELLDLRDYLPGDPPRMIAWKVSARRDRLITKEFESEVPVRCTLFVDTSQSVRLGPPGQNALSREAEIASAVAQATVGGRDLVGLCLFDEETTTILRPARIRRHLTDIMNRLADAAGLAPTQGQARVDELVPAAYAFVQEVYPHTLRSEVNAFPFWLPWLAPPALGSQRSRRWSDVFYRLLPLLLLAHASLGLGLLAAFLLYQLKRLADRGEPSVEQLLASLLVTVGAVVAGVLLWFIVIPARLYFPRQRRLYRWRKQLAALLSVRNGLAPAGLGALLEDAEQFSACLQRFLAEHHVPYALPLYDGRGRYLFASPGKLEVLAKALLNAVAHSHDNELYVLLADLLELRDQLGPLLAAVKVAAARHHQVLIVCPWPPGIPAPRPEPQNVLARLSEAPVPLLDLWQQATTLRFHDSFYRLRRTMARFGVSVLCAQSDDPAPLIVERLDRMRTARSAQGSAHFSGNRPR